MNTDKSVEIIGGAIGMDALEQSSFYQYLVDKGRQEGRQEGLLTEARRFVELMGGTKFGNVPQNVKKYLQSITSTESLEQLVPRINTSNSWDEFLGG